MWRNSKSMHILGKKNNEKLKNYYWVCVEGFFDYSEAKPPKNTDKLLGRTKQRWNYINCSKHFGDSICN